MRDNGMGNGYNSGMGEERTRRGMIVSSVGIFLNFILALAKMVAGGVLGLVSVVADGANNLSDCGSGVISLVSFRVSEKPADREHPYGHQRAEYVASMLIGFFVLLVAVELLRESVEKCIAMTGSESAWWMYLILGISIAVKGGMAIFYSVGAKRLNSDALKASAADSACDCLATGAVMVGALISQWAGVALDGYVGIAVALFIVWEGVKLLRDAGSKLLGRAPDPELIKKIRAAILEGEGVLGVHDLRVYRYGPRKFFATAHIETDASLPSAQTHHWIDAVERRVGEEFGVELTAHCDPVDLDDEEATEIESKIRAAVTGMYPDMDLHDFRYLRSCMKVAFEVGVPYDCKAKDQQIAEDVRTCVKLLCGLDAAVYVERE